MVSTISAAWKRHALAVELGAAAAAAVDGDVDAVVLEDALELLHVGEARHVLEDQRILGEERGDHQRQRGVLGARDGDLAPQFVAADQPNAIHVSAPFDGLDARAGWYRVRRSRSSDAPDAQAGFSPGLTGFSGDAERARA